MKMMMRKAMNSLEELIDTRKKLEEVNNRINYIWFKLSAPLVVLSLILIYATYNHFKHIDNLKTRDIFICKSSIKDQFNIIVDKKEGWMIKDSYFVKGDSKISTKRCKALREDNNE